MVVLIVKVFHDISLYISCICESKTINSSVIVYLLVVDGDVDDGVVDDMVVDSVDSVLVEDSVVLVGVSLVDIVLVRDDVDVIDTVLVEDDVVVEVEVLEELEDGIMGTFWLFAVTIIGTVMTKMNEKIFY